MTILVAINITDKKWEIIDNLKTHIECVVQRACEECLASPKKDMEISILLTGDEHIQTLNKDYRNKDKPTNVLSFPALCQNEGAEPILLGDIILSYETIEKESKRDHKNHLEHITHLLIHGVLHLFGYDHDSEISASKMEDKEISILKEFGISNPYAA